jgi:hypothetical protein
MTTHRFTRKIGYLGAAALAASLLVSFPIKSAEAAPKFKKLLFSREKATNDSKPLRFGSFGEPAINDKGEIAFYTTIYGQRVSTSTNTAIFIRYGNKDRLIARKGVAMKVSGTTHTFDTITRQPLINSHSKIYWGSTDIGVTYYNYANKAAVSRIFGSLTGATPGTEPVADFNSKNSISLVALDTASSTSPLSVIRAALNYYVAVVSVGDAVVGLPLSSIYSNFGAPTLDDRNNVYFVANITGTTAVFDGIWYGLTGDPTPLVTVGNLAPGFTRDTKFTSFVTSPNPAPRGKICAFLATADTTNGIFTAEVPSGKLSKVVLENVLQDVSNAGVADDAGVVGGDVVPVRFATLQSPAINDRGDVAFLASPLVKGVATLGLYLARNSTIEKIISVGDTFTKGTTTTTVVDIRFSSLGGINKKGTLVCTLSFANRTSGIYAITP